MHTIAYECLIRRTFDRHELPSLIETIFSSEDRNEEIRRLSRDDAQMLIDVIDEVHSMLTCCCQSVCWN